MISDLVEDYKECKECAAKLGSIQLCEVCLHNRDLVSTMKRGLKLYEKLIDRLVQ